MHVAEAILSYLQVRSRQPDLPDKSLLFFVPEGNDPENAMVWHIALKPDWSYVGSVIEGKSGQLIRIDPSSGGNA